MHDSFEMLFHRVFAEIEPVGDFFVRKAEHEVHDDHLLALGQMISLLNIGVGTFEFLIEFFHEDEQPAVSGQRDIRNTEPAKQEALVCREAEALGPDPRPVDSRA